MIIKCLKSHPYFPAVDILLTFEGVGNLKNAFLSEGHNESKVICFYNKNSHKYREKLSNTLFLITFNQNYKYWTSSTK